MSDKKRQELFAKVRQDVLVSVSAFPDETEIKGNALASGNDVLDRKAEDRIFRELDDGNIWAWCIINVELNYCGYNHVDHLGCCSYKDQQDFENSSGYYDDMVAVGVDAIVDQIIEEESYEWDDGSDNCGGVDVGVCGDESVRRGQEEQVMDVKMYAKGYRYHITLESCGGLSEPSDVVGCYVKSSDEVGSLMRSQYPNYRMIGTRCIRSGSIEAQHVEIDLAFIERKVACRLELLGTHQSHNSMTAKYIQVVDALVNCIDDDEICSRVMETLNRK